MWKRDEAAKPSAPQPAPAPAPAPVTPAAPHAAAEAARPQPNTNVDTHRGGLEKTVNIGKSVIIKGELNGSEDLTIEGQVEGKIELRQNVLTIGPNGKIKAQVFAKSVIILGEVTGNVTATEKVDIRDNGSRRRARTSRPRARRSRSQRPRHQRHNPRRLPPRGNASGNQRLTNYARSSPAAIRKLLAHSRVLNDLRHAH
jgi:hypothetical protein